LELSDAILTTVKVAGNRVLGRTAIQKLVYFLTTCNIVEARYRPHYYGPYSVDVASSIQMLSSVDFLIEEIDTPQTTGYPVPENWKRYHYTLSSEGEEIAKDFKKFNRNEFEKLSQIIEICGSTADYDMDILSWAAKVHYILSKKGEPMTYDAIIHTAESFGWKLSEDQVEMAMNLLENLDLCE
jgi:uncharacterized protein YwgA